MASKVRVTAQSQKWAALGIVAAYMKMYPHATLEDINKAFPKEQFANSDGRGLLDTMENLKTYAETTTTDFDDKQLEEWKNNNYFLTMPDGTEIAFTVSMWTKEMFEKIVSYAKLYDIEMAQYSAAEKGVGKRGSYSLEYLNGYVPPVPETKKKGIPWWLWLIIGLVIAGLIIALFCRPKAEPQVVTITETVIDTVYIQQIEEIEKNFNAAEFEKGKIDLSDASKFVLHDLATLMEKNSSINLKIVGHTSAEGDAAFNQKLSENRAKAAVDFLISQGISEDRLQWEGKGSSELKDAENPESNVNRRTEFIVLE